MTADYYAGGRVVGQAGPLGRLHSNFCIVSVCQTEYPGFLFSTDQRFSDGTPFRGTGRYEKKGAYRRKRFCNAGTQSLPWNRMVDLAGM